MRRKKLLKKPHLDSKCAFTISKVSFFFLRNRVWNRTQRIETSRKVQAASKIELKQDIFDFSAKIPTKKSPATTRKTIKASVVNTWVSQRTDLCCCKSRIAIYKKSNSRFLWGIRWNEFCFCWNNFFRGFFFFFFFLTFTGFNDDDGISCFFFQNTSVE